MSSELMCHQDSVKC